MTIAGKLLTGAAMSVISLVCAAAYADAPPPIEMHSSIVHYKNLNLNRPRDVARLYKRITVAADRVCAPRSLTGSFYMTTEYESCYSDAVAQAVARIDEPSVTTYYHEKWVGPVARKATLARQ
jgi:UrcA family protein